MQLWKAPKRARDLARARRNNGAAIQALQVARQNLNDWLQVMWRRADRERAERLHEDLHKMMQWMQRLVHISRGRVGEVAQGPVAGTNAPAGEVLDKWIQAVVE